MRCARGGSISLLRERMPGESRGAHPAQPKRESLSASLTIGNDTNHHDTYCMSLKIKMAFHAIPAHSLRSTLMPLRTATEPQSNKTGPILGCPQIPTIAPPTTFHRRHARDVPRSAPFPRTS